MSSKGLWIWIKPGPLRHMVACSCCELTDTHIGLVFCNNMHTQWNSDIHWYLTCFLINLLLSLSLSFTRLIYSCVGGYMFYWPTSLSSGLKSSSLHVRTRVHRANNGEQCRGYRKQYGQYEIKFHSASNAISVYFNVVINDCHTRVSVRGK